MIWEKNGKGLLSKFADTKLMMIVNEEADSMCLQNDLDQLQSWANTWGMSFNINKCHVLHLGKNNKFKYFLYRQEICEAESVRDLGVEIDHSFKFSRQAHIACKKANKILGMILRNLTAKTTDTILPLYRGLVRPHLEYAIQFWQPFLKKDIIQLEKVQWRVTRCVQNLRLYDYTARLKMLNLFPLEKRRTRGDLIETFKVLNGIDKISSSIFQLNIDTGTRGHNFKLKKANCRTDMRKNFFSNRVINEWNSLPHFVVNCSSVAQFKKKLDAHMVDQQCQ